LIALKKMNLSINKMTNQLHTHNSNSTVIAGDRYSNVDAKAPENDSIIHWTSLRDIRKQETTSSNMSTSSTCTLSTCSSSQASMDAHDDEWNAKGQRNETTTKNRNRCNKKNAKTTGNQKRKAKMSRRNQSRNSNSEKTDEAEKSKYLALDCEMVDSRGKSTLARVSIVNWEGEVVFNSFVRVEEPVTDYLTFVSGVRKADIESVDAMPFNECRSAVLEILDGKIVIGHGLKNDFRALKISHPWYLIRDSTKYHPFMKPHYKDSSIMVPQKLKILAKNKLGMIIQENGTEHDSIVDAVAVMELYKKVQQKWEKAIEWKRSKTNAILNKKGEQ